MPELECERVDSCIENYRDDIGGSVGISLGTELDHRVLATQVPRADLERVQGPIDGMKIPPVTFSDTTDDVVIETVSICGHFCHGARWQCTQELQQEIAMYGVGEITIEEFYIPMSMMGVDA